jgi:hypothetical protein
MSSISGCGFEPEQVKSGAAELAAPPTGYFKPQHASQPDSQAGQASQPAAQFSHPKGHSLFAVAETAQQAFAWPEPQHTSQSTAQAGQLPHSSAQRAQGTAQQLGTFDWAWALTAPDEPVDSQPISPTNDKTTNERDLTAVMIDSPLNSSGIGSP